MLRQCPDGEFLGNPEAGTCSSQALQDQTRGNAGYHRIYRGLLQQAAKTGKTWISVPKELRKEDRKAVGEDIKTAQFGWPIGMPLIRKIEKDLWEVRSNITDGIARTFFTVKKGTMVLLHGFVKKSQETTPNELRTARRRLRTILGG